jgi:light-regulated signal transduction histidine kinase (bacteriophytochrome)
LKDEYSGTLSEKGNLFLDKILSATDRMYTMIDGVLSYSTLASAEEPMDYVDLNEVLKNILADLEVVIQEKEAVVESAKLPVVHGASVLLYQLFYNLLNNSLKFSREDIQPDIHISASIIEVEEKKYHQIVVKDNGIGFDQQLAEKIFTTFIRLNSKDKYEGTGLGLALCKKIVQRHRGQIFARSEKDDGAEFTILLPVTI